MIELHSPRDDDDEVHDVPHVSEIAARVQDEALRQNLEARLHRENAQKVGLGRLLHQKMEGNHNHFRRGKRMGKEC